MRNYPFNCVYESWPATRGVILLTRHASIRSTCVHKDAFVPLVRPVNLILLVAWATSVFHLSDQDWSYSTYPTPCTDRVIRKEILLDRSFFSFSFFLFFFILTSIHFFKIPHSFQITIVERFSICNWKLICFAFKVKVYLV